MFNFIKRLFIHPMPEELAKEELFQAHREYLQHEVAAMYHRAMVNYNKERMMFLEDYISFQHPNRMVVNIELTPPQE